MYGLEIKNARKARGFTQTQVAQGAGLPQPTISWLESDEGIPNIYQCIKLADFYEISLDELVGREYEF